MKPKIQEVLDVFNQFKVDSNRCNEYRLMSREFVAAFEDARAKLKAGLERLGLAQHIDWAE